MVFVQKKMMFVEKTNKYENIRNDDFYKKKLTEIIF